VDLSQASRQQHNSITHEEPVVLAGSATPQAWRGWGGAGRTDRAGQDGRRSGYGRWGNERL